MPILLFFIYLFSKEGVSVLIIFSPSINLDSFLKTQLNNFFRISHNVMMSPVISGPGH